MAGRVIRGIRQIQPTRWRFLAAFNVNTNWNVPISGWYRIFCMGKSGDGGAYDSAYTYGAGGGGAGGMAVSSYILSAGQNILLSFNSGTANFGNLLYATTGTDGTVNRVSGNGGTASGGNIANYQGLAGGSGGYDGAFNPPSGLGDPGQQGGNSGMIGGTGGWSRSSSQPGGGGGGGGARLPENGICPYISRPNLAEYKSANGGDQVQPATKNADQYPPISLDSSIMLYGGGGGAGGRGNFSAAHGGDHSVGSPAIVIIEVSG